MTLWNVAKGGPWTFPARVGTTWLRLDQPSKIGRLRCGSDLAPILRVRGVAPKRWVSPRISGHRFCGIIRHLDPRAAAFLGFWRRGSLKPFNAQPNRSVAVACVERQSGEIGKLVLVKDELRTVGEPVLGEPSGRPFVLFYEGFDVVEQTVETLGREPVFDSNFHGHGKTFRDLKYEVSTSSLLQEPAAWKAIFRMCVVTSSNNRHQTRLTARLAAL